MLRRRLRIAAQSILVGWAALFLLTYILERPLILWTAPLVGAHWLATAKLALDCLALAATGWIIGRLHRSAPLLGVLAFAATLGFFNLDPLLSIDIPLLLRLAVDALRDTSYLSGLATMADQDLFLLGSLIVGGLLSRPPPIPLSLFGKGPR
jgi:hypothetical protein